MILDRLDDPHAAASLTGVLYAPGQVAEQVVALLDSPRPPLVMPRWRGLLVRVFDALPGVGLRWLNPMIAHGRRKQRGYRRKRDRSQL